jgi:FkbM family methyltransferase
MYNKIVMIKILSKPLRLVKRTLSFVRRRIGEENSLMDINRYTNRYKSKGYTVSKEKDGIVIRKENFLVIGKSDNTLWTGDGVFCKEAYHFSGVGEKKFVVFDIGLNIGLTALYLAEKENIAHVYGFEPFPDTFAQAENNLKLNPKLAEKITIYDFGLSDKNEILPIHYNKNLPGAMSTVQDKFSETETVVEVAVKKASEIIGPLIEKHNESLMMKIDCEGAEFEILPELASAGLLKKITVIIMEWHFKNPEILVKLLNENGFIVFRNHEIVNYQGIISAVNVKI